MFEFYDVYACGIRNNNQSHHVSAFVSLLNDKLILIQVDIEYICTNGHEY